MKPTLFSFLFFLFFISNILPAKSRQQSDSINYYKNLVLSPEHNQDLLDAFKFFEQQKERHLQNNDIDNAVYDLRMLAIIHFDLGMYYESEISVTEALRLIDKIDSNDVRKIGCYNQLGKIYRQLKEYSRALYYYEKILSLAEKPKDSVVILNNIGNIYKEQKQWQQAEKYLQSAYVQSLKIKDSSEIARTLDNLAFVQYKMGDKNAVNQLIQALKIRERNNDLKGLYSSYRHLVIYSLDNKNQEEAGYYASKGLETAQLVNSPAFLKDALSFFAQISDDQNFMKFYQISDSLDNIKQLQQNKYAALKYDFFKEKEKTNIAELKQEKEKNRKQLYQAIGVIILLGSFLIIQNIISKTKKEKQEEIYKTEIRISKKVHDEVANDVYQVMTKLQTNKNSQTELLDDLENIYTKTRDISKENSIIDVSEKFDEQLTDLLLSYKNETINIVTLNATKIDWDSASDDKKRVIYRVLQELMTNMKKHSKASFVIITFTPSGKKVEIIYKDNGLGCSLLKNTGLQNAENRILSVKGTITFETQINNGFQVKFIV